MPVQNTYTEKTLYEYLWERKIGGATLRELAGEFEEPVTYGDISRALRGIFPRNGDRRSAMQLATTQAVEVPPGKRVRVVTPTKPDPEYRPRCGHPSAEQRERINRLTPERRLEILLEACDGRGGVLP